MSLTNQKIHPVVENWQSYSDSTPGFTAAATRNMLKDFTRVVAEQQAEIARLSKPLHEREPPHCPTCDCGSVHEQESTGLTNQRALELAAMNPEWLGMGDRREALQLLRKQAAEIERLRNIVTGCPVCSELERNIRPAAEPETPK